MVAETPVTSPLRVVNEMDPLENLGKVTLVTRDAVGSFGQHLIDSTSFHTVEQIVHAGTGVFADPG